MGWVRQHPKQLFITIAAIVLIPYFAYQHMVERLQTREYGIQSIRLQTRSDHWLPNVVYADGTVIPADAYGMALINWSEYEAAKPRFQGLAELLGQADQQDFPIVIFFNASAYDVTGKPVMVRHARDGSVVQDTGVRPLRGALVALDSDVVLIIDADGSFRAVDGATWLTKYAGATLAVEPPAGDKEKKD